MGGRDLPGRAALRRLLPPWLAVPVRLAHYPAVAMAVAVGAAILALTLTSSRLFLDAAGDAMLRRVLAETSGSAALRVVAFVDPADSSVGAYDRAVQDAVDAETPELGDGRVTVIGQDAFVAAPGSSDTALVKVLAREGFADHVRAVATAPQPVKGGVWLADTTARELGVRPGDRLAVTGGDSLTVPVAGIYQDLATTPLDDPYWASVRALILPSSVAGARPPPLLLAGTGPVERIARELNATVRAEWEGFAPPGLTLEQAGGVAGRVRAVEGRLFSLLFNPSIESSLPAAVRAASEARAGLTGPVETISLAGGALALLLLGAAGVFTVRRRRVEMGVLTAQGVWVATLGARSAVEAALPAAAGAALGWLGAVRLAPLLNPSPDVARGTVVAAGVQVGVTLAAGLALLGVAAWLAIGTETRERAGAARALLAKPLWEAVVLVLAAASLYEIVTRGGGPAGGQGVDRLLVLFPLLFILGGAGLATRALGRLAGRRGVGFGRLRPAPFLALRRLAAAPRLALLLLTGAALAIGVLVYAGGLVATNQATALAKARVFVGADARATVPPQARAPDAPGLALTTVERVTGATLEPSGRKVDLLAVDPATFPRASYWEGSFAGEPLAALLERVDRSGEVAPVIAVGGMPDGAQELTSGGRRLFVEPVARARAFPGMTSSRPLLVTSKAALEAAPPGFDVSQEVWGRGPGGRLSEAITRLGVLPGEVVTLDDVLESRDFLALSWVFELLTALGAVAGAVAAVGLVLYLQARLGEQAVAYALAARMGLGRRSHRRAVALELGGMLTVAALIGGALAWAATALVYGRLDPMPDIPPAPLLRVPVELVGGVLAGVVLVSLLGAVVAQRRAERANVAEVLRLAG